MSTQFDLAQSFFIDKNAVENAPTVGITSVDLYFHSKPEAGKSATGIYKPGVNIFLCPMKDEQPQLEKTIQGSLARLEWDNINADTTGSTLTKFVFSRPIVVSTDSSYAILIQFDGSENTFKLWWAKDGENYYNTNIQASVNSGYNDGSFFVITNGTSLTKTSYADLKFNINVAQHTTLTQTYKFKESDFEHFKYYSYSQTGNLKVGEYVYKNTSNMTGTVSIDSSSYTITGSGGTSFNSDYAAGDYIVFKDGSNVAVRIVNSVNGASSMVVDEKVHFSSASANYLKTAVGVVYLLDQPTNSLILSNSNANSSLYFAANNYVIGEDTGYQVQINFLKDFRVNRVMSQFNVVQPSLTSVDTTVSFANGSYYTSEAETINIQPTARRFVVNEAVIGSKSLMKTAGSTSLFPDDASVSGDITLTTSNKYVSPYLDEQDADLFVYKNIINNDSLNEELGDGNAKSRYVSRVVSLGEGQLAEDIRVYTTTYVPSGTSVKVYGKFINPFDYESLSKKNWTLLEDVNPVDFASSPTNKGDVIEREYKIPNYPADGTVLSGYGAITTPNSQIVTTSDLSSNLVYGDLIRVYQEGYQNNFFISTVTSVNSSVIVVGDYISNTSFNGSMKIEKISDVSKNAAFTNPQNKNVVRYYSKAMAPHDTYNKFAVKLVLLSDDEWKAPIVSDVRAVAVSA